MPFLALVTRTAVDVRVCMPSRTTRYSARILWWIFTGEWNTRRVSPVYAGVLAGACPPSRRLWWRFL